MPIITVEVDRDLKQRMDEQPDADWDEVVQQAIRERLEKLELLEELTEETELTEADAEELASKMDEIARERIEAESR
ncbi:hypothetical protein [Halobellus marinus]|uniref:hypothetical protein n=1 Tax=Halobellus TaxID=1073986 RepID=UPI0028AB91C4|nr:hypothetical protein [Halobellus sp. DFY28]